jgi:hypothetical protein
MSTIAVAPTDAVEQLHHELDRTRVGRRWQRLYHAHEREVEALAVVHHDVRDHMSDAAVRLADATETRVLDPDTVRAASRVLDDLNRLGTIELRHTVATLREELAIARCGSLDAVLRD